MVETCLSLRLMGVAAAVFVGALLATVITTSLHAQQGDDERLWRGVFTTAQAERGKVAYGAYCTRCHGLDLAGGRVGVGGGPALAGEAFWQTWERTTLAALYRKVSGQMPADAPASLRDNEYVDIVSYILATNRLPAGASELTGDVAALNAIRVVKKGGVTDAAPNFALVQVVGCLSPGANGTWVLNRGTTPVVTRERAPSAETLSAAAALAPGTGTFRLLGARPFGPETRSGTRVEVRGLLNRVRNESRLDVLSLSPVGQGCP